MVEQTIKKIYKNPLHTLHKGQSFHKKINLNYFSNIIGTHPENISTQMFQNDLNIREQVQLVFNIQINSYHAPVLTCIQVS
jgi:hypothetical protein